MATKAAEVQLIPSELSTLATEINSHHSQAIRQAKSALEHARQAGELLNQAKTLVPHGRWLSWLEANCKVSSRQAQRYMRVAANWESIAKNDATSYLTIDTAGASIHSLKALLDEESQIASHIAVENLRTKAAIGEILNSLNTEWRELFNSILGSPEMEWQFEYLINAINAHILKLGASQ